MCLRKGFYTLKTPLSVYKEALYGGLLLKTINSSRTEKKSELYWSPACRGLTQCHTHRNKVMDVQDVCKLQFNDKNEMKFIEKNFVN